MKTNKRIWSWILVVVMLISVAPFSMTATAADTSDTVIGMKETWAAAGSSVQVDIYIEGNPGVIGGTLTVSWADGLTLVDDKNGKTFNGLAYQSPSRYNRAGTNFIWYGSDVEDVLDGTILTLTFEVEDGVDNDAKYLVSLSGKGFTDSNENSVDIVYVSDYVRVVNYLPGDVSGDGVISPLDLVMLARYISDGCTTDPEGYNITLDELAADVDDDGELAPMDLILISRYISDGCETDPDGYNVILKPSTLRCIHASLKAVEAKDPTCTEPGNIAYWICPDCDKCFKDADGTIAIDYEETVVDASHDLSGVEAKNPSYTENGNIAYWYCDVCEKYFSDADASTEITKEETVIPKLNTTEYLIEYDIANGDPYLQKLIDNGKITNPNPSCYAKEIGLTLKNLSVAGYRFLGWYDFAEGGTLVKDIPEGTTGNYTLYAYWSKIEYTVQYKSSLFTERAQDTYTVDTGLVLPTPKLSNYVFTGWADEEGKLYSETMIPVGSTGHMVLEANWTSERNKTWTKAKLDAPIQYEEDNTLYFVYEIGEIQNVPLYTIKDFGYISEGGIEKSEETTFSTVITEGKAEQIAETVANATTKSSNWSLSNGWSEATDISQEWLTEKGYTRDEIIERATNEESSWNVSTGSSGSTDTSTGTSNEKGWTNEAKITSSSSATNEASINAGLETTMGVEEFGIKAEVSASLSAEESVSQTESNGFETGGSKSNTSMDTTTTSTSAGWSNSSSYGGSKSSSESETTSTGVSEKITEQYGYGKNYTTEFSSGESQGLEYSSDESEEWSSSVTYNEETAESVTRTWTTEQTKAGYHRWVMAGVAHVFGVVAYDMETKNYHVYTYTVMDDEMYEFEDYSYTTGSYNDHENGVISFEIPYEVADYVAEKTVYSQGLKVNQDTGIVTGYTGTDNCVVIPEYMNVGNGEVIKIVGLDKGLFMNNTNISAVVLSDFITEIPDDCFNGCTALEGIIGGNIKKIGNRAFAGCESIVDCVVRSDVESVGEDAFTNVGRVYFNCANAKIAVAGVASGAKKVITNLKYLENAEEMNGMTLETSATTEYLEINGNEKTYTDLVISSDAKEMVLNKTHISATNGTPITISSKKLAMNQSSVSAKGIALIMKAEQTELLLQGTIEINSESNNAILGRNIVLSELNENVDGYLSVSNNILYTGIVTNTKFITKGTWEAIDETTYNNMLKYYTLYFDANGGICDETSKIIYNGLTYGALPTAQRDNFEFIGWYTEAEDGELITEDSIVESKEDRTLYAHWKQLTTNLIFDANGSSVSEEKKAVNIGEAVGELPTPVREGFTFLGWFNGDTQITEETVLTELEDITVRAHWQSGWVKASTVAEDADIVDTKWTYNIRTTSNSSTAPSGYTQYKNPTWVWGSYGSWSNWSRTVAIESDSRQIQTQTVVSHYNKKTQYMYTRYYGWSSSNGYYLATPYSSGICTNYESTGWLDYSLAFEKTQYFGGVAYSAYGRGQINSKSIYWYNEQTRLVDNYDSPVYVSEYRYRDRSKVYTYYYQKTEPNESKTEVVASDTIANVQKWVQYQVK